MARTEKQLKAAFLSGLKKLDKQLLEVVSTATSLGVIFQEADDLTATSADPTPPAPKKEKKAKAKKSDTPKS